MADQSLDARRIAREQEGRMAASASIGLNAIKPFVQFQTSMMRVFAENIEQAARNYERNFEAFSNTIAQQSTESRREAAKGLTEDQRQNQLDSLHRAGYV